MLLLWWIVIFAASLFTLIISAEYFTKSAEALGKFLGIPSFILGVTVIAVGTSLPELASSLFSVFQGAGSLVAGNVIGSNITNVFLVLGLTAVIRKRIKSSYNLMHVDMCLFFGSAFLLVITSLDGVFTFYEALFSVFLFAVYAGYISTTKMNNHSTIKDGNFSRITLVVLGVSALLLYFSAKYTVESVVQLSNLSGLAVGIISATAVALGTSLPELVVSVMAARKKKYDLALGNVLGSNIFNSLVVMGVPGFFANLPVTGVLRSTGLLMMLIATFMYFIITRDKEITRWEGLLLIIFYAVFLSRMLGLA